MEGKEFVDQLSCWTHTHTPPGIAHSCRHPYIFLLLSCPLYIVSLYCNWIIWIPHHSRLKNLTSVKNYLWKISCTSVLESTFTWCDCRAARSYRLNQMHHSEAMMMMMNGSLPPSLYHLFSLNSPPFWVSSGMSRTWAEWRWVALSQGNSCMSIYGGGSPPSPIFFLLSFLFFL